MTQRFRTGTSGKRGYTLDRKKRMSTAPFIELNELGKLFYLFERLGHPPIQRTHFEFDGDIDISCLNQAYRYALQAYPLFNMVLRTQPGILRWKMAWVPRNLKDTEAQVQLKDFSSLEEGLAIQKFQAIQFDPFASHDSQLDPPLRIVVCRLPGNRTNILTFFHHSACDAHGCTLFLYHLFNTYNRQQAGLEPCPPDPGPPLQHQSLLAKSLWGRLTGLIAGIRDLLNMARSRRGKKPAKFFYGTGNFTGQVHSVQRKISRQHMDHYLKTAKARKISFNTLFAAAKVQALSLWKQDRGEPCDAISFQVLQSIRQDPEAFRDVANQFSTFMVVSCKSDQLPLSAMLKSIQAQSEQAQQSSTAQNILNLSWLLRCKFPLQLLSLWGPLSFNSAMIGDSGVISNCGRLWPGPDGRPLIKGLGDARMTACYMAGYPVPSVGTFTSFSSYDDALFLCFNHYTWALSISEAETFVDLFLKTLDDLSNTN